MLFLVNFSSTLAASPLPGVSFLALAQHLATELAEPTEQTFVLSVLPRPQVGVTSSLSLSLSELTSTPAPPPDSSSHNTRRLNVNDFGPANLYALLTELPETEAEAKTEPNTSLMLDNQPGQYLKEDRSDDNYECYLNFDPDNANYNRLSEQLLWVAGLGLGLGLGGQYTQVQTLSGSESESESEATPMWNWQDMGPVVIIPPDDPRLAVFVGHALTHYLSEGEVWSGLYVVTGLAPLRIQEWD